MESNKSKIMQYRHRILFGMAVRRQREKLGYSQEKLAEHIDCHRNFVGSIELGKQNISIDSMARFAKALKVKLSTLFIDARL